MSPEEILNLLWGIAKALAETDTTYETGIGDTECIFCNGDPEYGLIGYKHQDGCPVAIAARLLGERNNNA